MLSFVLSTGEVEGGMGQQGHRTQSCCNLEENKVFTRWGAAEEVRGFSVEEASSLFCRRPPPRSSATLWRVWP